MDAEYLQRNVGDLLSSGLSATLLQSPPDSVEYLANWLLNAVKTQESTNTKQSQLIQSLEADQRLERDLLDDKTQSELLIKQQLLSLTNRSVALESFIKQSATNINNIDTETIQSLFQQFVSYLRSYLNVSSVYLGEVQGAGLDSIKYLAATENDSYLINTVLSQSATKAITFKLFQQSSVESTESDESIDNNTDIIPDPSILFIPNLLYGDWPKKLHFHRGIPKSGSYLAIKLSFDSVLNEGSLDESIEKEQEIKEQQSIEAEELAEKLRLESEDAAAAAEADEEDENQDDPELQERRRLRAAKELADKQKAAALAAETVEQRNQRLTSESLLKAAADEKYLLSKIQKQKKHYVLCIDTMNSNINSSEKLRLSESDISTVITYSKLLLSTLITIDRKLFINERKYRASFNSLNRDYIQNLLIDGGGGDNQSDEVKTEEIDKLIDELSNNNQPATEADAKYQLKLNSILAMKSIIMEWKKMQVFKGPLIVLQALFYLLDYSPSSITDTINIYTVNNNASNGNNNNNTKLGPVNWSKLRPLIDETFFQKLKSYKPRSASKYGDSIDNSIKTNQSTAVASNKNIKKLLNSIESQSSTQIDRESNYPLYEIYQLIQCIIDVRHTAAIERKLAAEAAEAAEAERLAQLEEERLRAEEEAEEKAAAEAENNNDGGNNDGDELLDDEDGDE